MYACALGNCTEFLMESGTLKAIASLIDFNGNKNRLMVYMEIEKQSPDLETCVVPPNLA